MREVTRVQAEGRPYDAAAARTCVDTVAFLARSCYGDDLSGLFEKACLPVFRGNLSEGAVCTFAAECATSGGCGSLDGGSPRKRFQTTSRATASRAIATIATNVSGAFRSVSTAKKTSTIAVAATPRSTITPIAPISERRR